MVKSMVNMIFCKKKKRDKQIFVRYLVQKLIKYFHIDNFENN